MEASISTAFAQCFNHFKELLAKMREEPAANMAIILRPTLWEDELGRLRLWSANIGAHQTSQSALDFRLRDASHIKNQIVKLLQGLHQILQDVGEVLREIEGPIQEALPADEDPEMELEQLLDNIKTMINCLFQMSMLVRKPTRHDFFAETQKPETSWFEPYDQGHVRDKHPHANENLVRRLGFAMTRRRNYLKYRERHRAKLSMGLDVSPEVDEEGTNILSETVATSLQTGHVESEDKAPEAAMSDTSYASTILEGGAITIPLPPKEAIGGAPFECPYCFFMISIKGSRAWPMHVFQDLQPYVCLFPTCTTPHKMYSSRREWFRHLRGAHLAEWARGQYESSAASTNDGAKSTLHAICPLCGSESGSETHFEHHLARHLQELALFVLPRGENEEEAIESEAEVDSIDANEGLEMSDQHDEAEKLYERALTGNEEKLGATHPNTLETVQNLANVYRNQGRYDAAEKLCERVLTVKEEKLGATHPDTLGTVQNLAIVYQSQGRYDEAAKLYKRALTGNEENLGAMHPNTLETVQNLANVYPNQGRYKAAEKLYEWELTGNEENLGATHPNTLGTVQNLANVYRNQGRYNEAEKLYERVLTGREEKLGATHPNTLGTVQNLANVYHNQGRYDEAEKLYKRALTGSKEKLGFTHPNMFRTVENLAKVYQNQGRYDAAEKLYERVLTGNKEKLGAIHPDTLRIVQELANIYSNQGRYDEAEKLYERALTGKEEKLGATHPDTLRTVQNLANVYRNQGRYDKAEKLYKRVLTGNEENLGATHPDTLRIVQELANICSNQGRYDEAEKLHERALTGKEEKLGATHPDTLRTV